MKRAHLDGAESCAEALTCFSRETRKKGRPREVEDETLRRGLVEANLILEQNWGLVGWPLITASTVADIRAAFNLVTGFQYPILDLYRFEPTEHTTHAKLRELRHRLTEARQQTRESYLAMMAAKESLDRVSIGLSSAPDDVSRMKIRSLESETAVAYQNDSATYERDAENQADLIAKLDRQEAYFAQSQVLELLQSKRCETTPLSVAMGMAGLPYVTSRISYDRCSSLRDRPKPGLAFEVFQMFQRVFAHSALTMDEGVERLKELALRGPSKKTPPLQAELRSNWYFVECAVHSVFKARQSGSAEIPYRLLAEYQRRKGMQSQFDVLMNQAKTLA